MAFRAFILDNKCVVVVDKKTEDQEKIFKHPFLLRLRCFLAKSRIKRRQRKLAKFNARNG